MARKTKGWRSKPTWRKSDPGKKRRAGLARLVKGKAIRPVRASVFPRGPRKFAQLRNSPEMYRGGPGTPPAGFMTATTSAEEWYVYWAISKVLNDPPDPRKPPYFGGRNWGYQLPYQGGRRRKGGSVADFAVYFGTYVLIIRLQTERYHVFADAAKQAYDVNQRVQLGKASFIRVVDIYSQQFIEDVTGGRAISVVRQAIATIDQPNPLVFGNARRARLGRRLG